MAQLHLFEQEWGDEAIPQGEELIENSTSWPLSLRAELLAKQAGNYSQAKNQTQAKKLSLHAAQLGDSGSVPKAVEELLRQRDQAGAARLLREMAAATTSWGADSRLEAALKLDDPAAALVD